MTAQSGAARIQLGGVEPDQFTRRCARTDRIVGRYGDMASWSLGKGEFSTARRYIRRGLKVDPRNPGMLALRADLDAALAEREAASLTQAELGRMAVEVTPSQPIIVPDTESESAFSRFIRYINGEN